MQVLVALFRRREQVVSRDELIEACREGRIVGNDALNRCISKIRKIEEASGAFRLETISKVGYRLRPDSNGVPAATPGKQAVRFSRPVLISAAVLLVVAVAGAIWLGI